MIARNEQIYTMFDTAINENRMTGGCVQGKSVIDLTLHFSTVHMCCDHQIILSALLGREINK